MNPPAFETRNGETGALIMNPCKYGAGALYRAANSRNPGPGGSLDRTAAKGRARVSLSLVVGNLKKQEL